MHSRETFEVHFDLPCTERCNGKRSLEASWRWTKNVASISVLLLLPVLIYLFIGRRISVVDRCLHMSHVLPTKTQCQSQMACGLSFPCRNRTCGFLCYPVSRSFGKVFGIQIPPNPRCLEAKGYGEQSIYLLLLHAVAANDSTWNPAFRMKAGNNSNTKIFRTQGESPRYHRDVLCTKRRQQLAIPSTCEANMEKTSYLGKIIVYIYFIHRINSPIQPTFGVT